MFPKKLAVMSSCLSGLMGSDSLPHETTNKGHKRAKMVFRFIIRYNLFKTNNENFKVLSFISLYPLKLSDFF